MSGGHVPNRYPDDAPLATVPTTHPPQSSPYTPLRCAPSFDFHPTSQNTNSSSPPIANQENIPPMATPPGTNDRKRKPDGYQFDASPKRPRQDILSGSPRSPLATQSQSRSNANHQHNHVEFPATPESTPGQTRKTSQYAELAPFRSMQDLRDAGLYVQEPDSSAPNSKYIAVAFGNIPGIYRNRRTASHQYNVRDGLHASFSTEDEAMDFMNTYRSKVEESLQRHNKDKQKIKKDRTEAEAQMAKRTPSSSLSHTFPLPTPPSTQGSAYYDPSPCNNPMSGPGVELSDEQKRVVGRILDEKNVFYTGSAGCGKSTILKFFVPQLIARGKIVQIIAPTNLAALAVDGRTLMNFAGWTPDSLRSSLDTLKSEAHGTQQWKKFTEIDVLVIEEISMVENLLLERLDEVMREARSGLDKANRNRAFGGVQIVVTGDFCQLAPVKPFQFCIGCGKELEFKLSPSEFICKNTECDYTSWPLIDKWAFRSRAWRECNFEHINLTEIFRQTDKTFVKILQRIRREGAIPEEFRHVLLNHQSETEGGVKIFSLRKDVYIENKKNIDKLPTPPATYKCFDHFDNRDPKDESLKKMGDTVLYNATDEYEELERLAEGMKPKNNKVGKEKVPPKKHAGFRILSKLIGHRYDAITDLKKEMRVVLQANIDPDGGLVNGTQGTIVDFESFELGNLPRASRGSTNPGTLRGDHARYAERQIRNYAEANSRPSWPVVEFDNGRKVTIYPDCAYSQVGPVGEHGKDGTVSLISRTQIPLIAGYAITVHKSQGMTLDKVIVDLCDVFEASQIYVALSRARTLKGLKILRLPPEHKVFGPDAQVREFFDTFLDPSSPHSATVSRTSQASQPSRALQSSQLPQSLQASTALPSSQMSRLLQSSASTQQSPLARKSNQMLPPSQEPPSSQLSDSFDVDEWDSLDVGEWL